MPSSLLSIAALFGAGVEFPPSDVGRTAKEYLAAFNSGEDAVRVFEIDHRSESALKSQSVEHRVSAYSAQRKRWGKLTPLRLVNSSDAQVVVQVGTSESGEMLELRFEFEIAAPHKLEFIWVRSLSELGPVLDQELRAELLRRAGNDQRVRTEAKVLALDAMEVDAENTKFLKDVIEKRGWPGSSLVAVDGANAAWLLAQHADADPAFQRRCLDWVQAAYERKEATGQELAYLTDRVMVAEGKPQRYGTQFRNMGGTLKPLPIDDPEHVDDRRRAKGLSPLSEYTEQMRTMDQKWHLAVDTETAGAVSAFLFAPLRACPKNSLRRERFPVDWAACWV